LLKSQTNVIVITSFLFSSASDEIENEVESRKNSVQYRI